MTAPTVPPRPSRLAQVWPPLLVWKRLDLTVLFVAVYTFVVTLIEHQIQLTMPQWLGDMAVVNGILLGVLLAFRNKEAYERWWEGRKLWGQLVNDSRNLALKARPFADAVGREKLRRLIPGFAFALQQHLRGGGPLQLVPGFETDPAQPSHVPLALAGRMYDLFHEWRNQGRLSDVAFLTLDAHARGFMDVSGACERIRSSPVPLSYRALLRHGTIFYLATAPWFMAGDYGFWAVAVVGLVAYFLLGIEFTAEDVEEPFGTNGDDLDLGKFCHTIQSSADDILK
ncbi:MAG TPA: bestrophin family ion channel [Fimbriiglobus sp.]|jgi:putative membrane protein